jgi:predicted phage baseplate assembly protein
MPIQLPNLDDRRFDDLFAEMRALIPRYAREWTDHNTSDPGIMLLELFAWLTEALIYRINRIPGASEVRFLELLRIALQPARPAEVNLKVTVTELSRPLAIAKGTPLIASSPESMAQSFETIHDVTVTPAGPGWVAEALVRAWPTCVRVSERLGISDDKPHQRFRLAKEFVMLDPPPMVTVDIKPWVYRENLLGSSPDDEHFTVDPRLNAVRFGDGGQVVKIPQDNRKTLPEGGKIPPKGAVIAAKYCYTPGEQDVLPRYSMFLLDKDSPDLSDEIRDALAKGATFEFTEPAAARGANPTDLDEARNQAIREVRRRYRAVTDEDFDRLVLDNEELNIARATCLPDLDLSADDGYASRPGHVSLIVIPKRIGENQADCPTPSTELRQQVWEFLNERRLITCRHHVVAPQYARVSVEAEVVQIPKAQPNELLQKIMDKLADFFDPIQGGPDHDGWPFGRPVLVSEVNQVIEETAGVDHVNQSTVARESRAPGQRIDLARDELVRFDQTSTVIQLRVLR